MKKLKILIVLQLTIMFAGKMNAQLMVKNSTNESVNVCIGWYEEGGNGFITKGWFVIKPNETIKPGLTFTSLKDRFYYYAYSASAVWEDKYKLLTDKKAFNIEHADAELVKLAYPHYEWKKFKQVDVNFGLLEEKTYTLNLTNNKKVSQTSGNAVTYTNSSGANIKIEGTLGDETLKFTITGLLGGNCTSNTISSTAEIHRVNMNGADDSYSGPAFWYEYSDETNCTITITPDLKNNTIQVTEEKCEDRKDGACKSWEGIYKKK